MSECKKHKSYKAKLEPRCDCLDCWKIYSKAIQDKLDVAVKALNIYASEHLWHDTKFYYHGDSYEPAKAALAKLSKGEKEK